MNSNPKNYKNLKALLSSLNESIDALENGSLNVSEIENLLDDARALHERIAIIQYLAAQSKPIEINEPVEVIVETKIEKPTKVEGFRFDFDAQSTLSNNQTSLLDAIDENEPEQIEAEEVPVTSSIKFETTEVNIKIESVEILDNSINSKFSGQAEVKTLAQKLSKKPISSIIEAIGLNQKFLFMNELFEGENTSYKEAIEQLNNFSNFDDANNYVKSLQEKHSWELESNTVKEFLDLVERRYL